MNDLSVYTDEEDVKPNNPFAERRRKQHSLLEIALEVLQTITCRKGPSKCVFDIFMCKTWGTFNGNEGQCVLNYHTNTSNLLKQIVLLVWR